MIPGPSPFPGSPDNLEEQVDYGGSDGPSPSTPGQREDTSENPSPADTPEDAPLPAEMPTRVQKKHPDKGVILVSEAFTEVKAGLVIVLKSGHEGPIPESDLFDVNRDPDELSVIITAAYLKHVEDYLATTSPPVDTEMAVSSVGNF